MCRVLLVLVIGSSFVVSATQVDDVSAQDDWHLEAASASLRKRRETPPIPGSEYLDEKFVR